MFRCNLLRFASGRRWLTHSVYVQGRSQQGVERVMPSVDRLPGRRIHNYDGRAGQHHPILRSTYSAEPADSAGGRRVGRCAMADHGCWRAVVDGHRAVGEIAGDCPSHGGLNRSADIGAGVGRIPVRSLSRACPLLSWGYPGPTFVIPLSNTSAPMRNGRAAHSRRHRPRSCRRRPS